jgi:hypothetical protein
MFTRQLLDVLDRRLPTLGDDVGGSELPSKREPVRVAAEDDRPRLPEAPRGDHADPVQMPTIYTAEPGSKSAQALTLLGGWATTPEPAHPHGAREHP